MESIQEQQQQTVDYNRAQAQQQQTTVPKKAYVKILEEPAGKALRFRYECEGRSAGSIPGVNSTSESKTYPAIEIVGYKGRAVVVVSCVTKDQPYRPHPHNLVGREGCKKGVCTLEINPETMTVVFSNLGIQCIKKRDIEAALKVREEIRVDPFKTGFGHRFQPSSIDLNSVRLCFQVFTESDQKGRFTQPLPPVVSQPIYDKKAMCDLVICRLCSCSASVLGNTQIILLCEKVAKEDISVRLFEEENGKTIWEAFGDFQHTDVHKQTAIAFRTPRYRKIDITEPAKVLIQLKRPSDGVTSEALPFEYIPLDLHPGNLKRKRQRTNIDTVHLLLQQEKNRHQNDLQDDRKAKANWSSCANAPSIKIEPRDISPQPFGMYRTHPQLTSGPQSHYDVIVAVPAGTQTRQPMISPSNTDTGSGAGNNDPLGMDISPHNYQQTQQQQQHYQSSSDNRFPLHNPLLHASVSVAPGPIPNNADWNLASNHFHPYHLQRQCPPHLPQTNGVTTKHNGSVDNTAGATSNGNYVSNTEHTEHGLSNLLTIDSEQYVRINSEDQQLLRLSSEDLQISNLSIST